MLTDADIVRAVEPALVGSAFLAEADDRTDGHPLWCVPTSTFRDHHPGLEEAVDLEHPEGCTDLGIYVDRNGRLDRVTLEMLDVAPDLAGQPIEVVLPEIVARLRRLLGSGFV